MKIADQGPIAGKYVFIHNNTDSDLPKDIQLDALPNAFRISLSENSFVWELAPNKNSISMKWTPDERPSDAIAELIVKKIKEEAFQNSFG